MMMSADKRISSEVSTRVRRKPVDILSTIIRLNLDDFKYFLYARGNARLVSGKGYPLNLLSVATPRIITAANYIAHFRFSSLDLKIRRFSSIIKSPERTSGIETHIHGAFRFRG